MDDGDLLRVLKALAHPKRFRMVQVIAKAGELCCGKIAERFPVAQPTISHHLKILTEANVLVIRRVGQHGLVTVNRTLIDEVAALLPARLVSAAPPAARARRGRARQERARPRRESSV